MIQRYQSRASTKKCIAAVAAAFQCACAIASAQGQDYSTKFLIIPAGTTLEGRIDARVGSSISHGGDHFHIVISSPVLANGSTVLIPTGSRIIGEVVEAVAASHVYRERGAPKPKGKLRVQLTALELPGGAVYPMVASLAGEGFGTAQHQTMNPNLGKGVGYIGSPSGFSAVAPTSHYTAMGRTVKPQLASREQLMHDPLYGVEQAQPTGGYNNRPVYRSVVQHGNNLIIECNSPLSVKIDAALRIPFDAAIQRAQSATPPPPAARPAAPDTPAGDTGF